MAAGACDYLPLILPIAIVGGLSLMPRRLLVCLLALAGVVLGMAHVRPSLAQQAKAEPKKHAFVVGINAYQEIGALQKAVSDAKAVAAAFRDLGHQVTLVDEGRAGRLAFYEAWGKFLASVNEGDTVVFYFAGHGLQIAGSNFLLPRDVPTAKHGEEVVRAFAIDFGKLADAVDAKKPHISLYILDACRDNPFKDANGKRAFGATGGLAASERQQGAFIMYAAGANEQALDWLTEYDPDPNSVYTRRLLPLLKTPGVSLVDLAKRLQIGVAEDARTKYFIKGLAVAHRQRPAYYDGIEGHFYLAGMPGKPASGAAAEPVAAITVPAVPAPAASPGGVKTIVISARDFVRGTNVAVDECTPPAILANARDCVDGRANAAEFTIVAIVEGVYLMEVQYAALKSRPLNVLINGKLVREGALGETTGGWGNEFLKWIEVGSVGLTSDTSKLRLERSDVFPHIHAIRFTLIERKFFRR